MLLHRCFSSLGKSFLFSFCFAKVSNNRLGVLSLLEPIYLRLSYLPGSQVNSKTLEN